MSIITRENSPYLYMKFRYKKKQYLLSTGTTDRKYAEKKERDFRSKLEKEDYLESQLSPEQLEQKREAEKAALHPVPVFREFVELPSGKSRGGLFWTGYATNTYSNGNTISSYRNRILILLQFTELAEAKLPRIDTKMIGKFVNTRKGQKRKPGTINRDLAILHVILEQAKAQGFITVVPDFPKRDPEKFIGRAISFEDEKLYMNRVHQDLFDFVMILIDTALEPGTIAELRWEDVRIGEHTLFRDGRQVSFKHGSVHGKCQKVDTRDRVQHMSPRLAIALRERRLRMGQPTTGWVFPADRKAGHPTPLITFRAEHDRMWIDRPDRPALPIRKFRLYDLRHTAITRYKYSNNDAFDLKDFAGWRSMRMADRYVHLDEEGKALAAERFHAYLAAQEVALADLERNQQLTGDVVQKR